MELSSHPSSSKAQRLVTGTGTDPSISSVVNSASPCIPGYPANAGSNMGGAILTISGSNFSGGGTSDIPVTFTTTLANPQQVIDVTGTLSSDQKTITVCSPATVPFGFVETYVVNVCINNVWTTYTAANSSASQQFQALATLAYSSGSWSADINVQDDGTVTILNKDTSRSIVANFWQPGGPPWQGSTAIGGATSTSSFSTSVTLSATNASATDVVEVLVTANGATPKGSGLKNVGSNGSINVGTSGG